MNQGEGLRDGLEDLGFFSECKGMLLENLRKTVTWSDLSFHRLSLLLSREGVLVIEQKREGDSLDDLRGWILGSLTGEPTRFAGGSIGGMKEKDVWG